MSGMTDLKDKNGHASKKTKLSLYPEHCMIPSKTYYINLNRD